MKNSTFLILCCCMFGGPAVRAQDKFFTRQGHISFNADGAMEKIEATSTGAICVLDTKTGAIQFAVLLKGFEFEKALMQEHFNENYVESDKFPKAEFKGQILNNKDIGYARDGTYDASVKGILTLHGESKEVTADGKIKVKGGKVEAIGDFVILFSDFRITIPALVKDKVADRAKIQVDCILEPLKN